MYGQYSITLVRSNQGAVRTVLFSSGGYGWGLVDPSGGYGWGLADPGGGYGWDLVA